MRWYAKKLVIEKRKREKKYEISEFYVLWIFIIDCVGVMIKQSRKHYYLQVNCTTSLIEEHNSFDYEPTVQEFSPTISQSIQLPLDHQFIHIFRHKTSTISLIKLFRWASLSSRRFVQQRSCKAANTLVPFKFDILTNRLCFVFTKQKM